MKQLMLFLLVCIGAYYTSFAQATNQVPQYYYAPQFDDSTLFSSQYSYYGGGVGFSEIPVQGINTKAYSIYYPSNFKYPPKGKITALYIWIYYSQTLDPSGLYKFYNFKIRMGNTSRDSFAYDSINKRYVLFDDENELTTVLQGNPYIFDSTTLQGSPIGFGLNNRKWLKIPLQVPFMYDPNKNLVIETFINRDTLHYLNSIIPYVFIDSLTPNMNRIMSTVATSGKYAYLTNITSGNSMLSCIGFDLDTTGVSGVEEVYPTQLSLYPNPATATINFSLKGSYTISTLQGALVQQGEVDVANITSLSQGLYIVQLLTKNGERLVGRFLKE